MSSSEYTDSMRGWIEAFARGFSAQRSLTHPFEVRELQPWIWLLSDAPRRTGSYRRPEVIAFEREPSEILAAIREANLGRLALCIMARSEARMRAEKESYKARGFRFAGSEPLFVADPTAAMHAMPVEIQRVCTVADAERIATAARGRQITAQDLTGSAPTIRMYASFNGEEPLGWVRSIATHPGRTWVGNLFVRADSRGRGIGRSLMAAMLADDAQYGVRESVLLASSAGARLYPHLGYVARGVVGVFTGTV